MCQLWYLEIRSRCHRKVKIIQTEMYLMYFCMCKNIVLHLATIPDLG